MGGYYCGQKNTVEESYGVSVAFLRKHDYFCGYRSGAITWTNHWGEQTASIGVTVCASDGDGHVRFRYTHTHRSTGEESQCDYKVPLVTTPCHFGGVRWWFLCPLSRDEPRLARSGGTGYALVLERRYDDLYGRVKRWTYRGRPTRKARRLRVLEARMDACCESYLADLGQARCTRMEFADEESGLYQEWPSATVHSISR